MSDDKGRNEIFLIYDFIRKKEQLKKNIGFRFKNSNGSNEMKLTLSNTASIYVLVQRHAIDGVMVMML